MGIIQYDKDELRTADCRVVADFIGMDTKKGGSNIFGECVFGLHSESNLNHMAIYPSKCVCFSCGGTCDVFGMVLNYYENILGTPISFSNACEIIGDAMGGHDLYVLSGNTYEPKVILPFTKEELEIIGFTPKRHSSVLVNEDKKERFVFPTLMSLYSEDKATFYWMIGQKAKESMEEYDSLSKRLDNSSEASYLLKRAYEKYYDISKNVYTKCGGQVKVRQMFSI